MSKDEASPKGPLVYNVDMGGGVISNLFDGLSAEELERITQGDDPPEATTKPAPTPAKSEEEEGDEPEAEAKPEKAEPEKKEEPEKPPEESKPAEPEAPKLPEKLKIKTKLRGVEEEREYTVEQIQANLNRLKMYDENQKEFWKQKQEVEPFSHIVKTEWFKRALKEAQESGEIEPPQQPPPVPPAIHYEVMKRQADPDYAEVLAELRDYAMTLPQEAMALLDRDATVFLPEYDRVAKIVRERRTAPPPEPPPRHDPKVQEKILQSKEKAKESAVVEKPGTAPAEDAKAKSEARHRKELTRRMRAGDMDAAAELALGFFPNQ